MLALRWLLFSFLFSIAPIALVAQGHRGPDEPKLDKNLMELPDIGKSDIVLVYHGFVVNYNTQRLIPNWVAYELTAEEVLGDVPRARGFSMDLSYEGRQAMREDYSNSGWDKGHMAPAADMKWSVDAMNESFYLTNVCPQDNSLNGGDWHTLEKRVRGWATQYGKVWIVCGPYVKDNCHGAIGDRNVVVPDGFFKAVLRKEGDNYKSIAFVFENNAEKQPVNNAVMSVNEVEALVGYDLFTNLGFWIEERVESQANWDDWTNR